MLVTDDNQYPRGKGGMGIAEWILRQLPSHLLYIEPFAGKAAVTRAKSPSLQTLLCDFVPELIQWLRRECPYAQVEEYDGLSLLAQLSVGSVALWPDRLDFMGVDRHTTSLTIPDLAETLIYCDPPYLHSTRTKTRIYDHEWDEATHVRFLELACEVPCPVAISGYSSELYLDHLKDWETSQIEAQTRGGPRTEFLWRNRLCVEAVAAGSAKLARAYSELGDDWRERDRVNRLVKRWAKNFATRPQRERDAILRRLIDVQRTSNGEG